MSNPLATFRKNRNFWMAGLVLLAIMAFIVAPAIEYLSQGARSGGAENVVVVSWDGGKVRMGDLQVSVAKHARLVRFLGALAKRVMEAGGQPRVPGFAYDPQSGRILGLGVQTSSNEVDVCRTRILATHAKRMGVEFSDSSADDFLLSFCDGRLTSEEVEQILKETTDGQLSFFGVRELLKEEMAAMVAAQMAETGITTQPPGRTWRDFLKLNETAKVEAFPVFVDDYVSQVKGEPTDAEIQAIFEQGSLRANNPNSSEPGFIRRYHARVEYVQANLQGWIDREKEKVTEEQLRAEYDRRLSLGQLQIPASTPLPADTSAATAEGELLTDDAPADDAPADDAPADEAPADEAPADDAPAGGEPGTSDQSMRNRASVKLVNFVQDDPKPPAVVQPPQLGDAAAQEPAGVASDSEGTESSSDSEDAASEDTAVSATETAGESPTLAEDAAAGIAQADPTGPQEMRNQTFEEARERIAQDLARDVAIPALDEALTQLVGEMMTPHYTAFRAYRAIRDAGVVTGEKNDPPIKPNLKKFAEERGLIYGETGLVDGVTLARTPFGLSNIRQDETGISGMVANVVLSPAMDLFKPTQSSYFDQAALMQGQTPEFLQFVFWKTEDRQAFVPELGEVRDEVIAYWKQTKAREMTEAAAKKLAEKVGSTATEPWKSALSDAEQALLISSDPFSWMSRVSAQPMISTVPKLDAVGNDFMESVFSTPVGQASTGPNESKRVYYVFRVSEKGPTTEDLQQRFMADPLKSGPMSIAREDSQRMIIDWYQSVEKELDVVWEIPLEQLMSNN